jgi:hypothetical protein
MQQANLLDPSRCPKSFKQILIGEVNKAESFEDSGLSLQIMNLAEFWSQEQFVSTSHVLWSPLFVTTEDSVAETATIFFQRKASGKVVSAPMYQALARRCAVFCNIKCTTYPRLGLHQTVIDMMADRVRKGHYDDDLDAIMQDRQWQCYCEP